MTAGSTADGGAGLEARSGAASAATPGALPEAMPGAGPRLARALLAAPRAALIALLLLGTFALGVPLQLRRARRRPGDDRLPRLFCRALLRLVGVAVEVRGRPAGEAVLLAANHVSWIDIPALAAVTSFCFLAKAEVGRWPLVSAFAAVQGTVFVDRRRRRSILPANRALAARLREGRHALIFPEGTTLAGPLPGPFLSSHFAAAGLAGAAVQPVAVAYSSPAAAWVGDDTLLGHLWRTLLAPPLRCVVAFGEPIPPPIRAGDEREAARQARASSERKAAARQARASSERKAAARQARAAVSALIAGEADVGHDGSRPGEPRTGGAWTGEPRASEHGDRRNDRWRAPPTVTEPAANRGKPCGRPPDDQPRGKP